MSHKIPLQTSLGKPLAALQQRAGQQPSAVALRARRRGSWLGYTWAQLADDARGLAQAWAALGLARGDSIVALGPLSFDFIVALFAANALGATLDVAAPDSQAETQLLQSAQWVLVEGSHELERLLRNRSPLLRHVFLAQADLALDVQATAGLALHSVDALLASYAQRGASTTPLNDVSLSTPAVRLHGPEQLAGPEKAFLPWDLTGFGERDRLLADFDTTWLTGLDFILKAWPATGALLLIPEPLGDACIDRRQAGATAWLAPASRLQALYAELAHRLPSTGLAAHVSQAALNGQSSLWAALARKRIRSVLGLSHLRVVLSDPGVPESLSTRLSALGIRPAPRGTGQQRPVKLLGAEASLALHVQDRLDGQLARSNT